MNKLVGLLILMILLAGCAASETARQTALAETQTAIPSPTLDVNFKRQLGSFLDGGLKLKSLTNKGVNYSDYSEQLKATKVSFELACAMWPSDFALDAKNNFTKALEGWGMALDLWHYQIEDYDNPVEPDINHFLDYIAYEGDSVVFATHPISFRVPEYQNKKFLPFDENISILFALANNYYLSGRKTVSPILP